MKKIIALMLVIVMAVGVFAACTNTENTDPTKDPAVTQPDTPTTDPVTDPTNDVTETPDATDGTEDPDVTNPMDEVTAICQSLLAITSEKPMQFPTMVMDIDLTDEFAVKSFTGLDSAEVIKEAAVSEAMMGSQAYSVVLVKVNDAAKAAETAEKMFNGIDPRKWICVEADDLKVAVSGDMIILAMMDDEYAADCTSADMLNAFAKHVGEISTKFGE